MSLHMTVTFVDDRFGDQNWTEIVDEVFYEEGGLRYRIGASWFTRYGVRYLQQEAREHFIPWHRIANVYFNDLEEGIRAEGDNELLEEARSTPEEH